MWIRSLAWLRGLRILCCHTMQRRSQIQLSSGISEAVVQTGRQLQLHFNPQPRNLHILQVRQLKKKKKKSKTFYSVYNIKAQVCIKLICFESSSPSFHTASQKIVDILLGIQKADLNRSFNKKPIQRKVSIIPESVFQVDTKDRIVESRITSGFKSNQETPPAQLLMSPLGLLLTYPISLILEKYSARFIDVAHFIYLYLQPFKK